MALDQHWHRDRGKPSRVLEGFEFVELEDLRRAELACSLGESPAVEASAVIAQEPQPVSDGSARAAEDSSGLAVSDLGDEGTEEAQIELGLLESVVDSKRLGREGAAALETQEALDSSAVAGAMEAALETPAMMAGRA
jgi:hypothetical protein